MNVVLPAPVIPITAMTVSFGLSNVNFRMAVLKKFLLTSAPGCLEEARQSRTEEGQEIGSS
jgi:hypothetical protein